MTADTNIPCNYFIRSIKFELQAWSSFDADGPLEEMFCAAKKKLGGRREKRPTTEVELDDFNW